MARSGGPGNRRIGERPIPVLRLHHRTRHMNNWGHDHPVTEGRMMPQIPDVPDWAPYAAEDKTMGEVAPIQQRNSQAFSLTPQSLEEAMKYADVIASSKVIPKDYQNSPGDVLVAMQWGLEIGLPPLQALQNIAVINGRPAIWGDAMLALVRSHRECEYVREDFDESTWTASCRVKRRGDEEQTRRFSLEDAKQAGLAGKQGPWQNYPKRMIQMRARAFALRDIFPDALRGMQVAEEVQDIQPEREVGPSAQPRPTEPAALPHYPEDRFAENLPKWRAAITSKKKSAADIIAMVETKGQLSDEQKRQIRAMETPEEEGTTDADA